MRTSWVIVLSILGILFFALGCMGDAIAIEAFGAVMMLPGIIGLCEFFWPEK